MIVGGSVGGLFAAHLLRAAGWDVAVFERSRSDLADRGASIGTRTDLFDILKRIGIQPDPSVGVAVSSRFCLGGDGASLCEIPSPSLNSSWDRIYRPLRDTLPAALYQSGRKLEIIEQNDNGVTAIFDDGTRESGDLLIAADGIHSTVRNQLLPAVQPVYAGYVAWRGVIEESALTADEHKLLFGRMAFCLPDRELLLSIGMPGRAADTRPGHRRYYWIWFRPADEHGALADLCTDDTRTRHGSSIPPHLVRRDVVAALHDDAQRVLAPSLAAIVRRTAQPFPHGVYDVETPRMVMGRTVLLGDSAFVARPHVGAGITKAALDAQCLADAVTQESDLATALARYERERHAYGKALIARARYLGSYLEAAAKTNGVMPKRQPETVLAEYGAAGKIG